MTAKPLTFEQVGKMLKTSFDNATKGLNDKEKAQVLARTFDRFMWRDILEGPTR